MSQLKRLRKSGSQESLVKKYEVTSQISSGSFTIKIKRIYSHHDDDSYTKDRMIMERVNDDCLAEIFMYLPAWERPKIALVCKKWKRALDGAWFNVKKLELTYWRYKKHSHFLKKNYPTIDGQFNFLKSLLYKCGHYLRELDLSVYGHCNIVPVINEYCPNLEKLQIRIRVYYDAQFIDAFTHLSKLKVLKIIFHDCLWGGYPLVPTTLINSLLNVADTLTDLTISNWTRAFGDNAHFPKEMPSVILQLKALRKFAISGVRCFKQESDYLGNSKTLKVIYDDAGIIRDKINLMTPFKTIKVLDIRKWATTDDGIYYLANTMKRLHTLRVSCTFLTDAGIVTCTKMNNLKCLGVYGSNNTTDSSIKLLRNMRELRLPRSNKITDKSVITVLENSPDMQNLVVIYTGITHKFIEKAAEISRNRKRQLNLWVKPDMSNTQVEYEYLTVYHAKKDKYNKKKIS